MSGTIADVVLEQLGRLLGGDPVEELRVPALVSTLSAVMSYSRILLLYPGVGDSDDKIS